MLNRGYEIQLPQNRALFSSMKSFTKIKVAMSSVMSTFRPSRACLIRERSWPMSRNL